MQTNAKNISQVPAKLKKLRGEKQPPPLDFIDTLKGRYSGENVLEGFCANAEIISGKRTDTKDFCDEFHNMCTDDVTFIEDLIKNEAEIIPEMTMTNLKDILFKKLKTNKACDSSKLTVEHLRNLSDKSLQHILDLCNKMLRNIDTLSCPQAKTAIETKIHKGKKKPINFYKSYRGVKVPPYITRILDEYQKGITEQIFQPHQSINQYGFSRGISYELGIIQRNECQKVAIDNKQTLFQVTFDGDAAFDVVDRIIQKRELYNTGEHGQVWQYSSSGYDNTECSVKMEGKLSRAFKEELGTRQGHCKAADHYKVYLNPVLLDIDDSELGFWIGPNCVSVDAVADDVLVLSGDKHKLQGLIDIMAHYGKRYRVVFGAAKMKIVVIGSDTDREYYKETQPWTMNGHTIEVVTNNEHLGRVISGEHEEEKNVEQNLVKGRKSLFSLLGPAFSSKCKLSPVVQLHLFRLFTCPITRSGLGALCLRPSHTEPLTMMHRKTLRGFLHLSEHSPVAALHFLTGELPIEARIHRDAFNIFWCIWANPDSKVNHIVKYILTTSNDNSRTWSIHLRHLSRMYGLPDPLTLLQQDPWPKSNWKETVMTKITAFHEKKLREENSDNSKMKYLNISVTGLRGRHHAVLSSMITTHDVTKARPAIKMVAGDYYTYGSRAIQCGGSARCRLCQAPFENLEHLLSSCPSTEVTRERIKGEIINLLTCAATIDKTSDLESKIPHIFKNPSNFTQFILDPTSLNLGHLRITNNDPVLPPLIKLNRDLCYGVHRERLLKLNVMSKQEKSFPQH